MIRRFAHWTAFCIAASALPFGSVRGQSVVDTSLVVQTYASGLVQPTTFAFLPGTGGHDALVCEKATGQVKLLHDGIVQGTALDLAVNSNSERGLLGIALHPGFPSPALVYLYYTASSTGVDTNVQAQVDENRVVYYTWNSTALVSPQIVLHLPATPGPNHDGGVILFGPDGMLYGVIGELNRNGKLQNNPNGADPDSTGIIFRVRDDGTAPPDNPFSGVSGMQKVYAYGVRNCFGLDFEPLTHALWDTENGPSSYDEVNKITPGSNSGWNRIQGPLSRSSNPLESLWQAPGSHYVDPKFSWLSTIAPTGIHFLLSGRLSESYRGDCFIGDNNTGGLYRFDLSSDHGSLKLPVASVQDSVADSAAERDVFRFGSGFGVVTDLDTGPDGALYVVSLSAGKIYRIAKPASTDTVAPRATLQLSSTPNPFRRGGTLLQLLGDSVTRTQTVRIYSAAGRLVRLLPGGAPAVRWDGRDARGKPVPPGVYHVRLRTTAGNLETKVVRLP